MDPLVEASVQTTTPQHDASRDKSVHGIHDGFKDSVLQDDSPYDK